MMPKGVEHTVHWNNSGSFAAVSLPMMPKGVEHKTIPARDLSTGKRESSDDAARR